MMKRALLLSVWKGKTTMPEEKRPIHELFTIAEVAQILRVDDATVRQWIKQGALQAVILPHLKDRPGGYRIKRETLEEILHLTSSHPS